MLMDDVVPDRMMLVPDRMTLVPDRMISHCRSSRSPSSTILLDDSLLVRPGITDSPPAIHFLVSVGPICSRQSTRFPHSLLSPDLPLPSCLAEGISGFPGLATGPTQLTIPPACRHDPAALAFPETLERVRFAELCSLRSPFVSLTTRSTRPRYARYGPAQSAPQPSVDLFPPCRPINGG